MSNPSSSLVRSEWLKTVAKYTLAIAVLWGVNMAGMAGNALSFAILIYMASQSSEGAVRALVVSSLIVSGNKELMAPSMVVGIGRYLLLVVAFFRVHTDVSSNSVRKSGQSNIVQPLVIFVIMAAVGAVVGQYYTMISIMKLFAFSVGAYVFLAVPLYLNVDKKKLAQWFIAVAVFVVFGSLFLYAIGSGHFAPEEYRMRSGLSLFCGVLNQSQTLGAACIFIFLYCLGLIIFTTCPLSRLLYVLLGGVGFLVMLTNSRTALFSIIISLGLVWLYSVMLRKGGFFKKFMRKSRVLIILAVLGLGGVVINGLFISDDGFAFAEKIVMKTAKESTADQVLSGRTFIIQRSYQNFLDNPVFGIGFGTSTDLRFKMKASWFSAPYEKSFIFSAVLEETGLLGIVSFIVFLAALFRFLFRTRNMLGLIFLSALVVSNLSEMTFFSFGGIGLFAWSFLSVGLLLGAGGRVPKVRPLRQVSV